MIPEVYVRSLADAVSDIQREIPPCEQAAPAPPPAPAEDDKRKKKEHRDEDEDEGDE